MSAITNYIIHQDYQKEIKANMAFKYLYYGDRSLIDALPNKALFEYKKSSKCCGKYLVDFNVAKAIIDYITYGVVGVGYNVDYGNDDLNSKVIDYEKKNSIKSKVFEFVKDSLLYGYGVLRAYKKEGKDNLKIGCVPYGYYFPGQVPGLGESIYDIDDHMIITSENIDDKLMNKIIRYSLEGMDREISTHITNGGFIPNSKLENPQRILMNEQTQKTVEVYDYLPLFIYNNDYVCNNKFGLGDSELNPVYNLIIDLYTLNTIVSMEIQNNTESKLSIPSELMNNIDTDTEGKLKVLDTDLNMLSHFPGNQPSQYIQKDPSYIDRAFKLIEQREAEIASVTGVPSTIFGLNQGNSNEPVGLARQRKEVYLSKIRTKREMLEPILKEMYRQIALIEFGNDITPDIVFNEATRDEYDKDTIIASVNQRIISKNLAKKFLYELSSEEAIEDDKQIEKEQLIDQNIAGDFNLLTTT